MNRYQYVVVRFVPNVVRDEGVNVGVIVRDVEGGPFDTMFLPRSATVRKLWPNADQRLVGNFARQLTLAKREGKPLDGLGLPGDPNFFLRAQSEFNGNLQLTAPRGITASTIEEALRSVYDSYVAEPGVGPRPINYQSIAPYQMRDRLWVAFERRGLIKPGLVQKQIVLQGRHAPWTFDLGYRNGRLNLINSVALNAPSPETNLGRALVFKGMLEDVKERRAERVHATAVVRLPDSERAKTGAKESQEILHDAGVQVVDVSKVKTLVETVQRQLGQ